MATLVKCLVVLRNEFNLLAPGRAKGADGWIGDAAHAARKSDHNPDSRGLVHAIDITTDLKCPGVTLEKVVQFVLARCRSGAEKRLAYIIFNRRIWQADEGWRQKTYTGTSDPHTGHAHFSASHAPGYENSVLPWHLADLQEDTLAALSDQQQKNLAARVDRIWYMIRNLESLAYATARGQQSRPQWKDTETNYTYPATPIASNVSLAKLLGADGVSEAELKALLAAAVPSADENAQALLAELGAESLTDAATSLRALLGEEKAAALGALLVAEPPK